MFFGNGLSFYINDIHFVFTRDNKVILALSLEGNFCKFERIIQNDKSKIEMKKYLMLVGLFMLSLAVFAQEPYKYVIIPTQFGDFGEDFNPYGLSSAVQKELDAHSIRSVFPSEEVNDDYCDALTVNLIKLSSAFKNKLKVELKDCRNKVVWSQEGTGRSKDFREGFGEAVAEALSGLKQLPINYSQSSSSLKQDVVSVIEPQKAAPIEPKALDLESEEDIYRPSNPYYNYTYFVDMVDVGEGKKELLVINGELLGYKNLQKIATLTPSGLDNVFTAEWITPKGNKIKGLANLIGGELKISFSNEKSEKVITLIKLCAGS